MVNMKRVIFFIVSIVLLAYFLVSCWDISDYDFSGYYTYKTCHPIVVNNSGKDVFVYLANDSILPLNYRSMRLFGVADSTICYSISAWEAICSTIDLTNDSAYFMFSLFVLDSDIMMKTDWQTIRNHNMIEQRFDLYVNNCNDTITLTNSVIK